jgi:Lon protease-like protein
VRRRLPLFVLPVTLLPGALLPLHVFEMRYRRMTARCLESDRLFGVLYHDPDRSGPFTLTEGAIGCVAEILQFQPLPDGRSLMLTRGLQRYRVVDGIESETLFTEALVESFADIAGGDASAGRRRSSLDLFLAVLQRQGSADPPSVDLAADLSFPLAAAFDIDPAWRQDLLVLRSETERLDRIDRVLRSVLP